MLRSRNVRSTVRTSFSTSWWFSHMIPIVKKLSA